MGNNGYYKKQGKRRKSKAVTILSIVATVLVLVVAVMIGFIVYQTAMAEFAAQRPEPVIAERVRPTSAETLPVTDGTEAEVPTEAETIPEETAATGETTEATEAASAPTETTGETQPTETTAANG